MILGGGGVQRGEGRGGGGGGYEGKVPTVSKKGSYFSLTMLLSFGKHRLMRVRLYAHDPTSSFFKLPNNTVERLLKA